MEELREKFLARVIRDSREFGLTEAKFIHTPQVHTAGAPRLRCQLSCPQTLQSVMTPPHTPRAEEVRAMLDEYRYGLITRREEPFGERDFREVWQEFGDAMLSLEKQCLGRGYPKSFTLAVGNCLAPLAEDELRPCDYPGKARPTLEALGIDLKETLEMVHWGGMVQRAEDEPMQLFALLLLE